MLHMVGILEYFVLNRCKISKPRGTPICKHGLSAPPPKKKKRQGKGKSCNDSMLHHYCDQCGNLNLHTYLCHNHSYLRVSVIICHQDCQQTSHIHSVYSFLYSSQGLLKSLHQTVEPLHHSTKYVKSTNYTSFLLWCRSH